MFYYQARIAERNEHERQERMAQLRAEEEGEDEEQVVGGGLRGCVSLSLTVPASAAALMSKIATTRSAREAKRRRVNENNGSEEDNDDKEEDMDDEQNQQMMNLLGFGGFGSTKGKAVVDNKVGASKGAVQKNKGRKYRQYMNRKGGFNRPLDKMN